MSKRPPRLLVVDDDFGVIAAYRLVLETIPGIETTKKMFGLDALEDDLFGSGSDKNTEPTWRVSFVDQGLDAVWEVKGAIEAGDPYSAIFLDVRMPPGIDGYETAERIRQLDPNVHIVVVTAFSDYTYEDFLEVAGPAEKISYMAKPVWPDELRKVAHILTSRKRSLEEQKYQ